MGTWGHGNFENDYALDEMSTRTHELLSELLQRMQRKTSREFDEYDYTTLFVEFEIVFALEAANLMGTGKFPAGSAIRELVPGFLAAWSAYMDGNASTEFETKRRAVIADNFERFAAICDKHEGAGPLPALLPDEPAAPTPKPTPKPKAKPKPKPKAKAKAKAKAKKRR